MSKLFAPLAIGAITLPNRIAMSPMCQYSAVEGFANDWHLVHYGSRATGGVGLIVQEATSVVPEGRITPGDLGLWEDAHIPKLAQITCFIEEQGAVPGIQLAHAGRKAGCSLPWEGGLQLAFDHGGWQAVAPSSVGFTEADRQPEALSEEGIKKIVNAFRSAASRALEAGYKVLEIHAAHGYLLHEFLSPLSNHRTDQYGGSFENRSRLLMEVVAAVQSVWPSDWPLMVRISATDWVEGGWDLPEATLLCRNLKSSGVHLIDTSSGGMVPWAKIPFGPNYQVPFAAHIREQAGIATGAVGLITHSLQAEAILERGDADLIFLGRELLRNPFFAREASRYSSPETAWPLQYLRAR